MLTDANGKQHEVGITTAYHDYWTAAGELRADCVCGWWDTFNYQPGGQDFARLKLELGAAGHMPVKATPGLPQPI